MARSQAHNDQFRYFSKTFEQRCVKVSNKVFQGLGRWGIAGFNLTAGVLPQVRGTVGIFPHLRL
jgi:hypothetical protein